MRPNTTPWVYSEPVAPSATRKRLNAIAGCSLWLLGTHCAVYDDTFETATPLVETHVVAAVDAANCGGGESMSTAGGVEGKDRDKGVGATAGQGGTPQKVGERTPALGEGGSVGGAGSASTGSGGSGAGGAGGAGDAGADAGSSGQTAGAGGAKTDDNVSRGKPTTSDSEQSSRGHDARDGNDGDRSTRWCATDWRSNHYWEVDLGSSFDLSSVHVLWEKNAAYLFKIETSADHVGWTIALDKTQSSQVAAYQDLTLLPGASGRYVKITVTGGLTTTVWASFYELDVFGHAR
jgi:hypothetical protein